MVDLTIILEILLFAVTPFLAVLFVAFFFKTFAREDFPSWMGIAIGLAFVGFDSGFVEIAKAPSIDGALKALVVMVLGAWGAKFGNNFADKVGSHHIKENGYHLLKRSLYLASGKKFIEIAMPPASEIQNIYGKTTVTNDLKRSLGGKKFVVPADLPIEVLEKRIRRRLINEWRVGDAEVKLDAAGNVVRLAISAKKTRISSKVPEGKVLFSFKPESVPFELCFGDRIDIFIKNVSVRNIEVLNVEDGVVLIAIDREDAEKLARKISSGMSPSLIVFPNQK